MKTKRMIPLAYLRHAAQGNSRPATYVNLRIRLEANRYSMDIGWANNCEPDVKIEMTENDLRALNDDLREAIQAVAIATSAGHSKMDDKFSALARAGRRAFLKIFPTDRAKKAIETAFGHSEGGVFIQVVTDSFLLPWELLYPEEIPETVSLGAMRSCWGLQYQIFRLQNLSENCQSRYQSPEIAIDLVPTIGLLIDDLMPSVVNKEVPFFRSLEKSKRIRLSVLQALDRHLPDQGIRTVQKFLAGKMHVAHFACHANYNAGSPGKSILRLTNQFEVSLDDLETIPLSVTAYPLVIFNACQTGAMSPLYTSHFARKFLEFGARGVVATDCEVPDGFAADFVAHLYDSLLDGESLGNSLLATRLHFFNEAQNPSGLLYGMYASPNIRFRPKGMKHGKKID
jgi:CHAT domain